MTQDEKDRIFLEIHSDVKLLLTEYKELKKALHGNGHPGLIREVGELKRDVAIFKWAAGSLGAVTVYILQLLGQYVANFLGGAK
jgi:hypothetical protein